MSNKIMMIKVRNATIWSTITQIISKLISPITNIILARLVLPETFGIVATVTIIISFSYIFTEEGFAKYLVQHEFKNNNDKKSNADVAFWSSLAISLFLWILILFFHHPIAFLVGNSNLGHVIAIACVQLPINSLASIQLALFTRDFNFKDIFISRIIAAFIPFLVTIPLAYLGYKHWAIIIGAISGIVFSTLLLTIKSEWKPSFFFNIDILKEMLPFSMWSILEGIFVWLTGWIDIIIISNIFSDYHLGLYIVSNNMVNALISIIMSATAPILFVTLSRYQFKRRLFHKTLLKTQKVIAYFLLPLGVGLFLYRDTAIRIILGSNWTEASDILGICALVIAIKTIFVDVNREAYKAIGKPVISLILEVLDLFILVPVCIISYQYGFSSLVFARSLSRFDLIIPGLILTSKIIKINKRKLLKNITLPVFCTVLMTLTGIGLQQIYNKLCWQLISIGICAFIYFLSIFLFDKENLVQYINMLKNKKETYKVL